MIRAHRIKAALGEWGEQADPRERVSAAWVESQPWGLRSQEGEGAQGAWGLRTQPGEPRPGGPSPAGTRPPPSRRRHVRRTGDAHTQASALREPGNGRPHGSAEAILWASGSQADRHLG